MSRATNISLIICFIICAVIATLWYALGYDNPDKLIIEPIVVIHDDDYTTTALAETEPYSEAVTTTEHIDRYIPNDVQQAYTRTEIIQIVEMNEPTTEPEPQPRYILTDDEKRLICFVADSEDHSSIGSRQCVMQVIMNRVESEKFPKQNTVTDVLYTPNQFSVMKLYDDKYTPSDEALEALEQLLYGDDVFDGECAIFFAATYVNPSRIAKGLYLVMESGGSRFYSQK